MGPTSSSTTSLRFTSSEPVFLSSTLSLLRSSQTQTSAKHSSHSAPLSLPRCSSTSRPTCPSALVGQLIVNDKIFTPIPSNRICLLHHQRGSTCGNPGDERLPGWHQEAQGPTEETQGCWKAVLKRTLARSGKIVAVQICKNNCSPSSAACDCYLPPIGTCTFPCRPQAQDCLPHRIQDVQIRPPMLHSDILLPNLRRAA